MSSSIKPGPEAASTRINASPAVPGVDTLNLRARRVERAITMATVVTPFVGLGVAIVLLWGHGVGKVELGLLISMYALTVTGIGVGFHRLIAHRAFQTNGAIKIILSILGSMAAEGPVLFWAAIHRRHHSYSDRKGDPHSPHLHGEGLGGLIRGLKHAHTGWLFSNENTNWGYYIPELLRDPILFKINSLYFLWLFMGLALPALIGGLLSWTWGGAFYGFLWGGLVRIFLVHHVTWSINSICHVYGNRPFNTRDYSANNLWLSLLSFGESWHNNHHAFPSSAIHGLKWWQIDVSGYTIQALKAAGLAWNVKRPTKQRIKEVENS